MWKKKNDHLSKNLENDDDSMDSRGNCCCIHSDNCLAEENNRTTISYFGILKPFVFLVVTTLLAMTVSHFCDKFSASSSLRLIRSDISNIRDHLNILTEEVKRLSGSQDEVNYNNIPKINDNDSPKVSETILKHRDEVNEDAGVLGVVKREIEKYDADKTGRIDYAWEASGGYILSTRNTETTCTTGSRLLSMFGLFCQQQNGPWSVIHAGVLPGQCWSFKGNSGCIVIQLITSIYITGITLEHIPSTISPTGEISTAPRDFSLWGLRHVDDTNGYLLGEFTYDNQKSPIQYFPIQQQAPEPFDIVEVKFHSNSGNPDHTCVYRIRIHGTLKQ